MERVIGTLFALGLLGSTVCASAEPSSASRGKVHHIKAKAPLPAKRFERLLSQAEADEAAYRAFLESADADQDTRVNATELEQAVQQRVLARIEFRFKHLDRDRNGKVTRQEVPRMDAARFARFDADADGGFTTTELASVMTTQVTRRCGRLIARLDFDRDGALSVADLDYGGDQRVAKLELAALLKSSSTQSPSESQSPSQSQ